MLALLDIFMTVLYARTSSGLLNPRLNRLIWNLFRAAARMLPGKKGTILSFCGPTLLISGAAVWILLLVVGFALIYWPVLGRDIREEDARTETGFVTALHVSGFALTTLGSSDIVPETGAYRLLTTLQGALGFSVFTLTMTYLLSVYGALTRRNAFTLGLHHRSLGTGDAGQLLARLGAAGKFDVGGMYLSSAAASLLQVFEAHHSYSVIPYFRLREVHYASVRMELLCLELATLVRTVPHPQKYAYLVHSAAVAELWGGALQLLEEMKSSFIAASVLETDDKPEPQREALWRERYLSVVAVLADEGIETVEDREEGARRYVELRREWDAGLRALAEESMFDWAEVAPAESGFAEQKL